MFSVGTKSLLLGAHYPPHIVTVTLAWRWLYGEWPTWKEFLAICIHDIGYIGCKEMDGTDGSLHPEAGAKLADMFLGKQYGGLIRGHSWGYAQLRHIPLSKLCGPDKFSVIFEPVSWYVFRTRLTGEIQQYRAVLHGANREDDGRGLPDAEWFRIVRSKMVKAGVERALEVSKNAPLA